jgi:hypothetical protein
VPLDSTDQNKYRELTQGDWPLNDLSTPSRDHAALYVTIALGILLVSTWARRGGLDGGRHSDEPHHYRTALPLDIVAALRSVSRF